MDPADVQKLGWVDEALAKFGKQRNIASFTRNYHVAIHLAKEMGPGNNIVTILCDSGSRYLSKLYNRNFLVNNELPCPEWV